MCLLACTKCSDSDSSHACAKSHLGICSTLIHSIVSNDSVSGKRGSWSDCADVRADLGFRCPQLYEVTRSFGAVQILFLFQFFSMATLGCLCSHMENIALAYRFISDGEAGGSSLFTFSSRVVVGSIHSLNLFAE